MSDPRDGLSLPRYLALGLLLRLPAVLFARGFEFVDQQFQYIDPAWHLATGQDFYPTWEWIDGIRSWTYPGFLAGIFRGLLALGIDEPQLLMLGARAVHALISLLPLGLCWLLLVRWCPQPQARSMLLWFAAGGVAVFAGVQPSGPALGATLSVAAVLAFCGPRAFPLLAGLCLGLAFCCRVQDALFGPVLFAVGLLQRRPAASLLLALGCLPGIAIIGCVDLATQGTFLRSAFAYVDMNLFVGAAAQFGTEPFWFYLVVALLPLSLFVPPFLRAAARTVRSGTRMVPVVAAAALAYFALHSLIGRKVLRFVLPALILWSLVLIAGTFTAGLADRWSRLHHRGLLAVQAALLLWSWCWFGHAGAVRSAEFLGRQPDFTDELVVVDGDATATGGFFYLRRPVLRVHGVARDALPGLLRELPPRPVRWLLAVRKPLAETDVAGAGRLLPVADCRGMFDLRRGERRFVYRLEPPMSTSVPR